MSQAEKKKISELSLDELKAYYELAQKRFDIIANISRANAMNPMGNNLNEFNEKRNMTECLAKEVDRRLREEIDWRN